MTNLEGAEQQMTVGVVQTVIMRRAKKADERKKAGSRIGPAKTNPASGGDAGKNGAGGNSGGKKKK